MSVRRVGAPATRSDDLVTRGELASLALPALTFADARRTTGQQIPSAAFTKINATTVATDLGNAYDASTSRYVVPATGIYLCTGLLRLNDGSLQLQNIGLGIHTSEIDGPWFVWAVSRTDNTNPTRQSFPYQRIAQFTQGDALRFYAWCGEVTDTQAAQFTVSRIG